MRFIALLSALTIAACTDGGTDDRARRHAAARLGADPSALRVTAQSDLNSELHTFHLVTSPAHPPLVVVVPSSGAPFDSETEGAFERVARAEQAAARLGRIGAERVALWFAALGGKVCPLPSSDQAHFATVERFAEGVKIRYPAGKNTSGTRTCEITLAPDGSLAAARLLEQASAPTASRTWKNGT
jgi:hypothetical protein